MSGWLCLKKQTLVTVKRLQNNYLMVSASISKFLSKISKELIFLTFPELGDYFQINFTVYELDGTTAKLMQRSRELYSETMRLNVYENHLSHITIADDAYMILKEKFQYVFDALETSENCRKEKLIKEFDAYL